MANFIRNLENKYLGLVILIVGILMVLFPDLFSHILVWALGFIMILRGILVVVLPLCSEEPEHGPGKVVLYCVMGIMILILGREAISIIGVMWAIFTLMEVSDEIDEMWKEKHWHAYKLFFGAVSISLAVTLMLDPFEHFAVHVRVLGLVIVSSSFAKYLEMIRDRIRSGSDQNNPD